MNRIVVQGDQMHFYSKPNPIPSGQSQFSVVEFMFSGEWSGFGNKIAQFSQGNTIINVDIQNNLCSPPSELSPGYCKLRIKGYNGNTAIATANELTIPVSQGFENGGIPPVPPTPDLYQQLIEQVEVAKSEAEAARDAATTAKTAAETAQAGAVSAKAAAQSAKTAAESAQSVAETARDSAVSAKEDAISAKEDAETAKTQVETAKEDAETAKTGAESARDLADGSAEDAEAWAVGKRGGVDVPSTDPAYNNSSKYHADESKAAKEDIEDSIEGVAQEDTAQSALSKINEITGFLQTIVQRHEEVRYYDVLPAQGTEGYTYITPDGTYHFHNGEYVQLSGSGDLNGFSLNLGENNEVLLSYTDPDDETITDTIMMPTSDTINQVISALGDIVISLAKIAGQEE